MWYAEAKQLQHLRNPQTSSGGHQFPVQGVRGSFLEVKRPWRDADY